MTEEKLLEQLQKYSEQQRALMAAIAAHADARLALDAAHQALSDSRKQGDEEALESAIEQLRQAKAIYVVAKANLEMARAAAEIERETLEAYRQLLGASCGEARTETFRA